MSAHQYVVTFDPTMFVGTRNNIKSAVVVAETAADAKAMLKSLYGGDSDAAWDNATFTTMAAATDLTGWTLHLKIIASDETVPVDVSVTGVANDTVDTLAAAAVTALNATAPIANASYNGSTNVLSVAGAADGLGDHRLIAEMYAPGQVQVPVPGFIGSIVQSGASGAALTVALAADSYTVPKVTAQFEEAYQ